MTPFGATPQPVPEGDPLPPDDHVVSRATVSLEDLYRRERSPLVRFLSRHASPDLAQEIVQRAFVKLAAFDEAALAAIHAPTAYLKRVAGNLIKDDAKQSSRRAIYQHVDVDEVEPVAPNQVLALETRDMLRRVESSLLRLKPRTREIFLAHRIDGFSYVEIACRTGLSVKAVEKHMSKAIVHLNRTVIR